MPSSLPSRGAVPHLPDGVTVNNVRSAHPAIRVLVGQWFDSDGSLSVSLAPEWFQTGTVEWERSDAGGGFWIRAYWTPSW